MICVHSKYETQGNTSNPRVRKQTQLDASNQAIIHTKVDLMSVFPNYFTGLGEFQAKPYYIEVDPSVPPKETSCRPVPIHWQAAFKKQLAEMQTAGINKPIANATPSINSIVKVNKTT